MKGVCLKFYTYEMQKHKHLLLYEWLLECARKEGFAGGFVLRAIAGFGHEKKIHEEHFFELASNVPIKIQFVLSRDDANKFLEILKKEDLHLFYTLSELEYGHI
jgi:PII-like signaling protein